MLYELVLIETDDISKSQTVVRTEQSEGIDTLRKRIVIVDNMTAYEHHKPEYNRDKLAPHAFWSRLYVHDTLEVAQSSYRSRFEIFPQAKRSTIKARNLVALKGDWLVLAHYKSRKKPKVTRTLLACVVTERLRRGQETSVLTCNIRSYQLLGGAAEYMPKHDEILLYSHAYTYMRNPFVYIAAGIKHMVTEYPSILWRRGDVNGFSELIIGHNLEDLMFRAIVPPR